MTAPWNPEPGKDAVVRMIGRWRYHADEFWTVEAPGRTDMNGGTSSVVHVSALHPLPPTMSAEDAAIIAAAVKWVKRYCPPGSSTIAFAPLGADLIRAVRSRAAKQEVKVETEELPGDMLARLGDDASKWAAEFCKTASRLGHPGIDEGWMIGWFANAIEHSCAVRRWATEKNAPSPDVAALEKAIVDAAEEWRSGVQRDDVEIRRLSPGAQRLIASIDDLRAALTPPAPVDPVAELREAAEAAIPVMVNCDFDGFDKVVARLRTALARAP